MRLEIGFGGGEHLTAMAERYPDWGFIGCEPFINGVAKAVTAIGEKDLTNIRIHDEDARPLLDALPKGSIDAVDLNYPDPWPKKRHWKRRFIVPANLDRLARIMKPGAPLRFATDIESYVVWALEHARAHPDFTWEAGAPRDWRIPFRDWPGTRYETKAKREGRRPHYLTFRRCKPDCG